MAAIGALLYSGDGQRARVLMQLHAGNVRTAEIVGFLRHLKRHVRGRAILIWTGSARLERRRARLHPLPASMADGGSTARLRPELNPVEALWAWTKQGDFANTAVDGLDEVADRVRAARAAAVGATHSSSASSPRPGFQDELSLNSMGSS